MAIAKSNRSAPRFAGRPNHGQLQAHLHRSGAARSPTNPPVEPPRELFTLAVRLRAIYGSATTVELALRQQAAEQDAEIADCLREGVCNQLFDEIYKLDEIARRCVKTLPRAKR